MRLLKPLNWVGAALLTLATCYTSAERRLQQLKRKCRQTCYNHKRKRQAGSEKQAAGEKKSTEKLANATVQLITLLQSLKAGSPTDATVYWISLKPRQVAQLFEKQYQFKISHGFVKQVLKEQGYGYRKQSKQLATGTYSRRNEQFEIICAMVLVMSLKSPVLSMDCKKKERLGHLYRGGKCYCTKTMKVYDHDYEHLSEGKVVPHGIYDMQANEGYLSIGSSSETEGFVVDNLLWWWQQYGIHRYPDANNILLFCDAGGANSYRHHGFKYQLQAFAKQTELSVIVCHYPPYCSKWNPIEHRLFCHVHKAMEGVILCDYQTVQQCIGQTGTQTGLSVVVRLNLKHYPTGIKIAKELIDLKRIAFHPLIPELNYRIYP